MSSAHGHCAFACLPDYVKGNIGLRKVSYGFGQEMAFKGNFFDEQILLMQVSSQKYW